MDELLLIFLSLVCSVCIGAPAFLLCRPFADLRGRRWQKALMLVGLGYMGSLPIWVGDPNLLYALPVFLAAFLLCTRGDLAGRLAVGVILFCLIMSLSALINNYAAEVLWGGFTSDVFSLLLRAAALTGVWHVLKKRLPEQPVSLSPRLWRLVLGLAAMPLCSLAAVVLLTGGAEPSPQVDTLALKMGLAVLPVALVTSVLLLFAILVLAEHETLEQARRLASLREAYYQALRARESQVRQLRHDLRNHLSVLGGLMEQKRWAEACAYLDELGRQEGLRGPVRFCENEAANVVLAVKAAELEQAGVRADFKAQLPSSLPLSDTDLCALLGNALDNAREGRPAAPSPGCACAAGRTRACSCCGWKTLFPARWTRTLPPPRRTAPPTASASPACGRSPSGAAEHCRPGPIRGASACWSACPPSKAEPPVPRALWRAAPGLCPFAPGRPPAFSLDKEEESVVSCTVVS